MTVIAATVDTEVMIVGAGPAGATAAMLLASYGVDNIVINKYGGTARTPRAHITNQRAMEVFRDLGLEEEVNTIATPQELMAEHIYCTNFAGEEIGRIKAWGNHPDSMASHAKASPTRMCDLPQDRAEPILVRGAAAKGSKVRFNTEYLSHEQDADGVTTLVKDQLTDLTYAVRSKYLIGADGANSKVVQDLGLNLEGQMGLAGSVNMVFRCDLEKYAAHRPGVIYWIMQPSGGVSNSALRMVEPWNRWLATVGFDLNNKPEMNNDEAVRILKGLIGDDDVKIEMESISYWTINDVHATENMKDRVICMGDAVHRHPPFNGLGSNTSMQDAFNLAWKLKCVLAGQAAPSLLESYQQERVPVGRQIVKRANQSGREMMTVYDSLHLLGETDPHRVAEKINARKDQGPEAVDQRIALRKAIDLTKYDFDCHGVEMNIRYESNAIISDGSPEPEWERDEEMFFQASSRPGANLPHAWLERDHRLISTLDLCGKGEFSLLTGIGGEGWREAASRVEKLYGLKIRVSIIGAGQDYEDSYGDFASLRETEETGALLVRPDFFVCWRAQSISDASVQNFIEAIERMLGR